MKLFFLILFLVFRCIFSLEAQEISVDQQFEISKEQAYSGDYETAIEMLQHLTDSIPQNTDYKIFLARVYGWNEDYSEAISTLLPLIEDSDFEEEIMKLMVTTQLWAKNYEEVIRYSNLAMTKNDTVFFKMEKAKALKAMNRDIEAKEILKDVLRENPDHKEATAIRTEIYKKKANHISFSYLNTSFSDPGFSPWHLAYLDYKRSVGNVPVLARFNYGNLYGLEGALFEIDAYPKLGKNSYLFLNAGTAIDTPIFPQFRAAAEYFLSLNGGFAISMGSKYFHFKNDQVLLFTGEMALTTKNNTKIAYRPYLADVNDNWFLSHTLAYKITNAVKESFIQFDVQYGSVPYVFFTSNAFTDLTALRVGVQYQFRLTETILVQPNFMYEYEEYLPSEYRNRFNSQIITTFRF